MWAWDEMKGKRSNFDIRFYLVGKHKLIQIACKRKKKKKRVSAQMETINQKDWGRKSLEIQLTSSCNRVFFMLSYFLKPLRSSVRKRKDISSPWSCNSKKEEQREREVKINFGKVKIMTTTSNLSWLKWQSYLIKPKNAFGAHTNITHWSHLCHNSYPPMILHSSTRKMKFIITARKKICNE